MSMVRLFVEHPLAEGQSVPLSREHVHYLGNVMRLSPGGEVRVFNGEAGEWAATIDALTKRTGTLRVTAQTAPQRDPPDVWLCFAPIKKARTDFIVEKAAELGAARIVPVQTEFTNAERIRQDRLQAHAVEAAEQCGGTFVPPVGELTKLDELLSAWPEERHLLFCDETRADSGERGWDDLPNGPWAILIGPEGGFSEAERHRLHGMGKTRAVSLGPRVLRADTAAVAALTLWQSAMGDWA